jgi:hypothetical protein
VDAVDRDVGSFPVALSLRTCDTNPFRLNRNHFPELLRKKQEVEISTSCRPVTSQVGLGVLL